MPDYDYSLFFGELGHKETTVRIVNHTERTTFSVGLLIDYRNAFKMARSNSVDVTRAADAFGLAAMVHIADRMVVRHGERVSRIRLVAPAWFPGLLSSPQVDSHLRRMLNYYTGDEWFFEWSQRPANSQKPEPQSCLDFGWDLEVGLWSGGLDSAAGLIYRAAQDSNKNYVAVGTGANDYALGVQRQVFRDAQKIIGGRMELLQVPLHIVGNAEFPKDPGGRARGFVFTLVGGVCSYLHSQEHLHVYENGVGAINLPYCAAEVGLDHARSVHPSSLWEMSYLLKTLLGGQVAITNPFLLTTKAQMCESLISYVIPSPEAPSRLANFVLKTVSCDSPHRQADMPTQCGYCTSCLLRRHALAVCGIEDKTLYAIDYKTISAAHSYPLRAMLHQVATLRDCLKNEDSWLAFRAEFPQICDVFTPDAAAFAGGRKQLRSGVLALYSQYCDEWDSVEGQATRWFEQERIAA